MEKRTQQIIMTLSTIVVVIGMSIMSILYMYNYGLKLAQSTPGKVATWASLATFAHLPGAILWLWLGQITARERLRGMEQGAEFMRGAARDVVEIRRSAPAAPTVNVNIPDKQADDLIVRPATPTSSRRTAIDVVDME